MVAVMSALAAKLRRLLCSAASAEQGRLLRFLWQVWLWLSKQLCWLMQMGMCKVWGWASFMTGGCRYRLAEKLMPSCTLLIGGGSLPERCELYASCGRRIVKAGRIVRYWWAQRCRRTANRAVRLCGTIAKEVGQQAWLLYGLRLGCL